jgi:ABC-type multidrug transport system fused ATPase/permease subunit
VGKWRCEKLKEWIKKNKNEIIVGIVVFVVTTFGSKLIHILFGFVPSAGNSVLTKLRDFMYYQAGHQSVYGNIAQILTVVYSFILVPALYWGIQGLRDSQNASRAEKVNEIIESLEKKETIDTEDKKRLEKAKRLNRKAERYAVTPQKRSTKYQKAISIVITIFMLLFACYIIIYDYIPILLSHSFELSMVEIAPYVDEDEEEILRSKWALMDGMDKYNEIDDYIKSVKESNGLK